jgi:hypothetical protein
VDALDPPGTSSVHSFFTTKQATTSNTPVQKVATSAGQSAPNYAARVPLPQDDAGLTRSQRLFTISTGVHVDSLAIGRGDEFFVFMKLRAQHKWASFRMTPLKWVKATKVYNAELESVNRSHNRNTTLKNPRALVAMLGTVEAMVADRLMTGNYKCEPASPLAPCRPFSRNGFSLSSL